MAISCSMTMPRMLGYVFNPVSFWFCRDRAGALRAVLCEVNNTFGETHCYLVHHDDRRPIEPDAWLEGRKAFHVSPFLPVEGGYRFRFRLDDEHAHVDVNYHDAQGLMLATSVGGRREALDDRAVLRRFLGNPTMTLAVIVRIHWQAFASVAEAGEILPQARATAGVRDSLTPFRPHDARFPLRPQSPRQALRRPIDHASSRRLDARLRRRRGRARRLTSRSRTGVSSATSCSTAISASPKPTWRASAISSDLPGLIALLAENEKALGRVAHTNPFHGLLLKLLHRRRDNSREGSKKNIHAHYDLGNEFYGLWLDPLDDLLLGAV